MCVNMYIDMYISHSGYSIRLATTKQHNLLMVLICNVYKHRWLHNTCVCLNARSTVNKKKELNITVEDIDSHIKGITES